MNPAIISTYWNPADSWRIKVNAQRWLHDVSAFGIPTIMVAAQEHGELPFRAVTSDQMIIRIDEPCDALWQKERLLNLAESRLPSKFDHVAFIDADFLIMNPKWLEMAERKFTDGYRVVQLWRHGWWLDANGNCEHRINSVGDDAAEFRRSGRGSPGGAVMVTRDMFPLYDRNIVGGGDESCMHGWTGTFEGEFMANHSHAHLFHFLQWAAEANHKSGGKVTDIDCGAIHLFHGTRSSRRYWERHMSLVQSGYDPSTHVREAKSGLLEWTEQAPESLRNYMADYFVLRNDDGSQK